MNILYSTFLIGAAWYDLKDRRIPVWLFYGFGILGMLGRLLTLVSGFEERLSARALGIQFLTALLPGAALLAITFCSRGEIGAGDGCFFLVSACYLDAVLLFLLLVGGLFLCTSCSLGIVVWGIWGHVSVRRIRLPFLPFLVPVWLLLTLF